MNLNSVIGQFHIPLGGDPKIAQNSTRGHPYFMRGTINVILSVISIERQRFLKMKGEVGRPSLT